MRFKATAAENSSLMSGRACKNPSSRSTILGFACEHSASVVFFFVAGFGIQSIKNDKLLLSWPFPLYSSALIVAISLVLLGIVYLFDRHYYTPLLIGAVTYAQELERALRDGREIIDKAALARLKDTQIPTERGPIKLDASLKTDIYGKTGFISYYVSKVHRGLHKVLGALYGILGIVLFVAFSMVNFRESRNAWLPLVIGAVTLIWFYLIYHFNFRSKA
jgi:hypothetical protein